MAKAQLQIKDENGNLILDLSNRITRLTRTYVRTTPTNSLLPPEFIVLDAATNRNKYWCYTRFDKTKRTNGLEFAPVGAIQAFIATQAEINSSGMSQAQKNLFIGSMQPDKTYLIITDGRDDVYGFNIVNTCTITVGMY